MRYRTLGNTGTQVSVLCLGAMTFGEADEKSMMHKVGSSEDESFAILDRALEVGINFVDTATCTVKTVSPSVRWGAISRRGRLASAWWSQPRAVSA